MNYTIGYKFGSANKGITVRFSENTKNNTPQPQGTLQSKRRETSQNQARGHQQYQSSGDMNMRRGGQNQYGRSGGQGQSSSNRHQLQS